MSSRYAAIILLSFFALWFAPVIQAEAEGKNNSSGNTPLNDLGAGLYLGQYIGGLYPNGLNTMPAAHFAEGLARASAIQPLDISGNPDPGGKIVFLSVGMSNAMMEYCGETRLAAPCAPGSFSFQAANHAGVNRQSLFIVNGAKGSQGSNKWDDPAEANYDEIRDMMLTPQGLTEAQVQVVWMKMGNITPAKSLPEPNADAFRMLIFYGNILRALKIRYPNLQQVFVSSRIYAGYATGPLNPEPFAYEYRFATQWLIKAQIDQMAGGPINSLAGDLNYSTVVPWVAWGPYLWADGLNPRSDGLIWEPADFMADGVHPTMTEGVPKVGTMMIDFFLNDMMAAPWFTDTVGTMGSITGTVGLQGLVNPAGATARALLWNSENISTTTDIQGGYTLPVMPAMDFRISVEMPGFLRVEHQGVNVGPGETVSLPQAVLPAGDVNDDGSINILDLTSIGAVYGLGCGDPGWISSADLNQDCIIDVRDLALVGGNYGLIEPVIWP